MLTWPANTPLFWLAAVAAGLAAVTMSSRRRRAAAWWAAAVVAAAFGPGLVLFLRAAAVESPWRLAWWGGGVVLGAAGAALAGWALFWDRPRGRRRCRGCWYDLSSAEPDADGAFTCPECGRRMAAVRDLLRTRRRWWWAVLSLPLLAGAACLGYTPRALDGQWRRDVPEIAIILMLPHIDERDKLAEESFNRFLRYGYGRDGRSAVVGGPRGWLLARQAGRALDRTGHPTILMAALHAIAATGERAAGSVERLRALVRHPSNDVRLTLATELGMMHLEPAVAVDLLRPLVRDPVPDIRRWAADAMSRVGRRFPPGAAPPPPQEVFRFGGDGVIGPAARREAVLIGLFAPTPQSADRLAQLWGSSDSSVRAAALSALARHEPDDDRARRLLADALSDRHPGVAAAAAELLAERGPRTDADLDLILDAARRLGQRSTSIYESLARSPTDPRLRSRALLEAVRDPALTDAGVEFVATLAHARGSTFDAVLRGVRADLVAAGCTADEADAAVAALAARAREMNRD